MKRIPRLMLAAALAATTALTAPAAWADAQLLTVDLVNEPSSLDPHVQWNPDSYYVYRNIFDNLLTRDDAGEIVPQVATEWEQVSPTEIIFTIRDDIAFHDGSPLTPQDVVYSVQRITDPEFGSPQLSQFATIASAEVLDGNKVKLTTSAPYPALMGQLVKLSIVPQAIVEGMGKDAFNQAPVGSGPYKFDGWDRGVEVRLTRNDDYWGQTGTFPAAVFRAVPDASTRVANLVSGASDLVVTMDPDLAMQLDAAAGVGPRSALTERVAYLAVNGAKPGLDDLRLRQAIAHAIDRDLIVEGLLGGFDMPVGQLLTPAHIGWVEGFEGVSYDPDKARALIAEVGEPATRRLSFATSPVFDQRIVQALQQMLTEVGLNVEIELTDMATYLGRVQGEPAESPDMSFGRWSCACQDADGVVYPLLHSSSSWSRVSNAELDAVLEAARGELDPETRLGHYRVVQEWVRDNVSQVPLYQAAIIYGASDNLEWQPTPNESLFLNRMSWSD
ncbi:ABC transporter substrate-binding protein [Roseinatronobacter sp. NSM]|uniref:ABC transporter substrate-binding protein n=1 Tax=Roseinatronobacter sp. NSM TaxID=3457785 RepID=UPI00403585F2